MLGVSRLLKVLAKALRADFHLTTQFAPPRTVGSRERVTRYRHFIANCWPGSALGRSPPAGSGIERLNRVGRADDPPDLDVELQERRELGPSAASEPKNGRLAVSPGLVELHQPFDCGSLGRRGLDGLEVLGELVPVPTRGISKAIALRVNDADSHCRPQGAEILKWTVVGRGDWPAAVLKRHDSCGVWDLSCAAVQGRGIFLGRAGVVDFGIIGALVLPAAP